MFKLIVTVLILSDTGTPTVSMQAITLETDDACRRLETAMTYTANHEALGHRYVVRSKGRCEVDATLVAKGPRPLRDLPPVVPQFFGPDFDNR